MDAYLRMRFAHNDTASTYVYLLTHKASASFSEIFNGDSETFYGTLKIHCVLNETSQALMTFVFKGVTHADEKLYLFPVREELFPNAIPTKDDEEMRESIVKLWVDFATTG